MGAYRELFSHRRARWPLLTSSIARLTPGMILFGILLLMRDVGYDYAAVGLVTAGHQVGIGVGSPIQGRLADRFGQVRILVPDSGLYLVGTLGIAGLALSAASPVLLLVVAVLTGAVYPPVTACARVLLSRLFPTGQVRETAFAVSTIAVELGFVVGPLAAAGVAVTAGPVWAVIIAGAASTIGAGSYSATSAARAMPRRETGGRPVGALRAVGVRVLVIAIGFIAVAIGVVEIVVPAVAEAAGRSAAVGSVLLAAIAAGSLLGGLVYGGRVWPGTLVQRVRVLVGALVVGLALVSVATDHLVVFGAALFVGGVFLAPTMICTFQLLDDNAIRGTQVEAQSWLQTSVVFGVALGTAGAGLVVEAAGPRWALLAGAAAVFLGATVINASNRVITPVPAAEQRAGARVE